MNEWNLYSCRSVSGQSLSSTDRDLALQTWPIFDTSDISYKLKFFLILLKKNISIHTCTDGRI